MLKSQSQGSPAHNLLSVYGGAIPCPTLSGKNWAERKPSLTEASDVAAVTPGQEPWSLQHFYNWADGLLLKDSWFEAAVNSGYRE